jgi:hypothetical protein
MNDNSGCAFFCVGLLCCIIGAVVANKVRDKYPQAMDVYQGKTTLEYTIRDGEIIDSVVVFKNK